MKDKELMELKHDPVPGYRPAFYLVFGASLAYLSFIFFTASAVTH